MSIIVKKVIAIDLGNGFVKAICDGKTLILPNFFARKEDFVLADTKELDKELDLDVYVSGDFPEEEYVWGPDIYLAENPLTTYTAQDRYVKKNYKLLFQILMGRLVKDSGASKVEVVLVTGVPSSEKGTKLEEQLAFLLDNSFEITVNGKTIIIKIVHKEIAAQPMGTFFSEVLGENGTYKNKELLTNEKEYTGIIDIGTGSSDADGVKRGKAQQEARKTVRKGMSNVYTKVMNYIQAEYPTLSLTTELVEKAIREGDGIDYPINSRKKIRIKEVFDKACRELAEDVIAEINKAWTDRTQFSVIFLTGGGAKHLYEFFKEDFGEQLELVEDPQIANVLGFYRFGLLKKRQLDKLDNK